MKQNNNSGLAPISTLNEIVNLTDLREEIESRGWTVKDNKRFKKVGIRVFESKGLIEINPNGLINRERVIQLLNGLKSPLSQPPMKN